MLDQHHHNEKNTLYFLRETGVEMQMMSESTTDQPENALQLLKKVQGIFELRHGHVRN